MAVLVVLLVVDVVVSVRIESGAGSMERSVAV